MSTIKLFRIPWHTTTREARRVLLYFEFCDMNIHLTFVWWWWGVAKTPPYCCGVIKTLSILIFIHICYPRLACPP